MDKGGVRKGLSPTEWSEWKSTGMWREHLNAGCLIMSLGSAAKEGPVSFYMNLFNTLASADARPRDRKE